MTHADAERMRRPESSEGTHGTHSRVLLAEVGLVAMALIWGINFSVIKYGTTVLSPLAYNGVRMGIATIALWVIAHAWAGPAPARRDLLTLLALGVLGNGIYQVLFIEGLARTRAGEAALVIGASPAFMALIGRVRGIERVTSRGALGVALSIFGVGLIVLRRAATENGAAVSGASLFGDLLVLCGSLLWAVYTILLMPYTKRVNGWWITALTISGGWPILAVAGARDIVRTAWLALPTTAWAAILYSGLAGMVIAYIFWYYGVRTLGPVRTALYGNLQPLIALLVAWLMLGETPTPWQAIGAATIVGGVLLTRVPATEAT